VGEHDRLSSGPGVAGQALSRQGSPKATEGRALRAAPGLLQPQVLTHVREDRLAPALPHPVHPHASLPLSARTSSSAGNGPSLIRSRAICEHRMSDS
jgi:hypothetical protein